MEQIIIDTKKRREVIDITQRIAEVLHDGDGTATIFVQHTTASVATAELDPGSGDALIEAMEDLVPDRKNPLASDPARNRDTLLATFMGPAVTVPFQAGRLLLGPWQRIVLIEFAGPRRRSFMITVRPLD